MARLITEAPVEIREAIERAGYDPSNVRADNITTHFARNVERASLSRWIEFDVWNGREFERRSAAL